MHDRKYIYHLDPLALLAALLRKSVFKNVVNSTSVLANRYMQLQKYV